MSSPSDFRAFDDEGRLWTVYPYTHVPTFRQDDNVFVNLHSMSMDGEGVVVSEGVIDDADSKWKGRYRVRFLSDGSEAHVNPKRIYPRFPLTGCWGTAAPSNGTVILTSETVHYRELAVSSVLESDFALDIGSSAGVCTNRLGLKTKNVIGFDISDELLEKARSDFPTIRFEKLNILEEIERFVELAKGATVVFADIGGDRDFESMAAVLDIVFTHLTPRLVVVKNRAMVRSAAGHIGRAVTRHKGYDRVKWSGRMEVLHNDAGWISCDGPWWLEGLVSQPQEWINRWRRGTQNAKESKEAQQLMDVPPSV